MKNYKTFNTPQTESAPPKVTIALSTLGENITSIQSLMTDLTNQSIDDFELLIVQQTSLNDHENPLIRLLEQSNHKYPIRLILTPKKGLLRSRNIAIKHSSSPLILLADDDCTYFEDSLEKIVATAANQPSTSVLTFQALTYDEKLKNPRNNPKISRPHTIRSVMSVCSIEFVIRKDLINYLDKDPFDENFGLGTPFNTGGENIMLIDLLRKNLKVTQNPIPIVKHPHKPPLTSSTELNQMYFAKGAMFRRMYGIAGLPIAFLFITKGLITKRYNVYNLTPYKQIIIGFIKSPQQKKPSG